MRYLVGAFLFILSATNCYGADTPSKLEAQLLVENILSEIQRALVMVQNESELGGLVPPLSSVTLKLSTQFISEGKAKLSLYIITFGGGVSGETAQTLTLKLIPPKKGARAPVSTGFGDGLAQAIISAGRAVATAQKEKPQLSLSELSAEIKFVVKKEGEGGLKFTIAPVTAEIGGDIKSAETQEISVSYQMAKQNTGQK